MHGIYITLDNGGFCIFAFKVSCADNFSYLTVGGLLVIFGKVFNKLLGYG